MHLIGFMHQHERTDANPKTGYRSRHPSEYVIYGPYDGFSAVGYLWTQELSDLDAFKINKMYNCSWTTRGNQPIDLTRPTSLPKRLAGPIKTVDIDCPWKMKKAYTNIAHITVDESNRTITMENQYNEQRTECEVHAKCYLPYMDIVSNDLILQSMIPVSKDESDRCLIFMIGAHSAKLGDMYYDDWNPNCIAVIQGNIAPDRKEDRFICLISPLEYKVLINSQV